jgi:hypothetical protein
MLTNTPLTMSITSPASDYFVTILVSFLERFEHGFLPALGCSTVLSYQDPPITTQITNYSEKWTSVTNSESRAINSCLSSATQFFLFSGPFGTQEKIFVRSRTTCVFGNGASSRLWYVSRLIKLLLTLMRTTILDFEPRWAHGHILVFKDFLFF